MRSILIAIFLIALSSSSCHKPEKTVAMQNGSDHEPSKAPSSQNPPENQSNLARIDPTQTNPTQTEIEFDALRNWHKDPGAYFSKIQRLKYPTYLDATVDEKRRIKTVTSGVAQMVGAPVADRLEFIYKLIPNNETPFIVDDMIRVSDQNDLTEISDWLKKRSYSSARTELYRLILDRMQRLGTDNQKIQAFIESLEYEDEQAFVRKFLVASPDVLK